LLQHAELVHFRTPTIAPSPFDFSGHWVNELNSYMDLHINGNTVTGSYVSAVTEAGPWTVATFSGLWKCDWRSDQFQCELG
jgi:hypothetical protein